jgi:TatD DNase family protein
MLIDTHCHLDAAEFGVDGAPGRDAVVADARAAGVGLLVLPAVETGNFAAVADCCRRYPEAVPAYGIHPMYTPRAPAADLATLRQWLERELAGPRPPVAVGEIGLDLFQPELQAGEGLARQEHFFVEQLKIARDFNLPVLLHVRRAIDPVLKQLRRIPVPGGIAHAFNGSRQQAEEFLKLGFKLGFGGTLSYSGSSRIRALAAELPEDALVLETDAPDIRPAFAPDTPNRPQYLAAFAATLAELRGTTPAAVAAFTSANARAVLPGLAAYCKPSPP